MSKLTPTEQARWADSKQPQLYGSMGVFLILANSAFLCRLFCQLKIARTLMLDDAFLAVALTLSDTSIGLFFVATHDGFGLRMFRVLDQDPRPPQKLVTLFKYIFVNSVLQTVCLASVKLALLFFYRRVFIVNQKWLRIAWWSNFVYIIAWFLGSFFFFTLQCLPPSYYWTRFYAMVDPATAAQDPQGSCNANTSPAVTTILILSLISDVTLLILPVGTIATLQMSRRKKLALEAVFGVGLIAVAVSIGRIVSIAQVSNQDPTYNIVNFMIVTIAEQITAIVCACGPVIISPLLRHIRQKRKNERPTAFGSKSRLLQLCTALRLQFSRRRTEEDNEAESSRSNAEFESNHCNQPQSSVELDDCYQGQIVVQTEVRISSHSHK